MKNYEKYADEIREYKGIDICGEFIKSHILEANNCNGVDCRSCAMLQMLWLLEDYKEPEVDWGKAEVDTPILAMNDGDSDWNAMHFAKYEDGIVYTWDYGTTSWTTNGFKRAWKYAKLAETEGGE